MATYCARAVLPWAIGAYTVDSKGTKTVADEKLAWRAKGRVSNEMRVHPAPIFVLGTAFFLAVFPYGWRGLVWRPFGRWLDSKFWAPQSHYLIHIGLFGAIAAILLLVFPRLIRRFDSFVFIVLGIGVVQEVLQLCYKSRLIAWNDGKDLAIDLLATAAIFGMVRLTTAARSRHDSAMERS
jgi:hypothetical protein